MKYMFYHLGVNPKTSEARLKETYMRCKDSGLYDDLEKIFLYVNHCPTSNRVGNYIDKYVNDDKIEVKFAERQTATELATTTWLWEFCKELEGNHEIYYSHSKGVFRKGQGHEGRRDEKGVKIVSDNVDLWNEYLEYWCMYRRKDCWEGLKNHYTAGPFLQGFPVDPFHYSGNFWWANSDYIKTLHKPDNEIDKTQEFWLLSDLYRDQNVNAGVLDVWAVGRKTHFKSVHQPFTYIQNAYLEPILKCTYYEKIRS